MRDYLQRLLGDRYEVAAVADGAQALAAARQSPPDLVLADVMRPGMDGFELLRSLRTDPQTQTIPIVLLSARAGEESRVEGLEMGADDYPIKPFSARELLARVDAHLQLAQMRREAIYWEQVMQEVQAMNDRLEQQVKARTAQLESVNEELEAFASAIAHDLRTPLRYINNFADRLRGKLAAVQIDASSLKSLDIIAQAALGAEKMVGDLLEFSRLGQTKLQLTTVIMERLVQEVRAQLMPELAGRSIQWQIEALPAIAGDPVLLQIVLQNLQSNAIKYTSHRELVQIAIGSIEGEEEVIFFVRDNGAGFDMKYRDRLFTMTLADSDLDCQIVRTQTRAEFVAAIETSFFDLILADYSLPGFDGITALGIAQSLCPDTPFIKTYSNLLISRSGLDKSPRYNFWSITANACAWLMPDIAARHQP